MGKQGKPRQTAWTKFEYMRTVTEPDGEVSRMYANSQYTVLVNDVPRTSPQAPRLIHLSIRRNDRDAIRDWRHLQRIKNELVGPECEGVEIFPAEADSWIRRINSICGSLRTPLSASVLATASA